MTKPTDAEGQAKRQCRMPETFSFSPAEIRQFVTATANGPAHIDLAAATASPLSTAPLCPA
jgi:hypothetical protein